MVCRLCQLALQQLPTSIKHDTRLVNGDGGVTASAGEEAGGGGGGGGGAGAEDEGRRQGREGGGDRGDVEKSGLTEFDIQMEKGVGFDADGGVAEELWEGKTRLELGPVCVYVCVCACVFVCVWKYLV